MMEGNALEIREGGNANRISVFPNPLNIGFREGKILISKFYSGDHRGIMLSESTSAHVVGGDAIDEPPFPNTPQPGQVYLSFGNVESARVLHEILGEVISEFESPVDYNGAVK